MISSSIQGGEQVASIEKIIDKMERQPHGVRYEEGKKVLEGFGYVLTTKNGSHRNFRNAQGDLLTIKEETPTIKKHYVDKILSKVKA